MTEVVSVAVLGLFVGPLLRLCIDRIPDRLAIFGPRTETGRSGLDSDLLPVVSWWSDTTPGIMVPVGSPDDVDDATSRPTRRQAWRAPAIDVSTGAVLAVLAARFGWSAQLPAMLAFGAALVVVTVIDIDHYRIPDRVVFPSLVLVGGLLVVAAVAESVTGALVGAGIGALAYFGFLFLFFVISPSGMGFGDVKLALLLGLVLGWTGAAQEIDGVLVEVGNLDALRLVLFGGLAGSVLGSIVGLAVIAVRGRRAHFPSGPSLCIGALGVVVFSASLLG